MNDAHPYRTGESKPTIRQMPRYKARLRRLVWNVIAPVKVISIIALVGLGVNGIWAFDNIDRRTHINREGENHYGAWEKTLNARQALIDEREKDLVKQQNDLNSRVHTFEDVLRLVPLLTKNNDDAVKTLNNALNIPGK